MVGQYSVVQDGARSSIAATAITIAIKYGLFISLSSIRSVSFKPVSEHHIFYHFCTGFGWGTDTFVVAMLILSDEASLVADSEMATVNSRSRKVWCWHYRKEKCSE